MFADPILSMRSIRLDCCSYVSETPFPNGNATDDENNSTEHAQLRPLSGHLMPQAAVPHTAVTILVHMVR